MIIASNVSKQFGKLKALNNVSVTCNKGECIALIGPNGSGKTTFIKSILGMVVPDSGFITFNGKNILHDWLYREYIGYMPQIGRYPDNMTIGQVLDMMKDIRKKKGIQYDEELINAFELQGLLGKRMRTLSGGTRQKVSACLAFLFNPEVLILDEPTAGLDPVSSEILKEKIITEKKNGKLILTKLFGTLQCVSQARHKKRTVVNTCQHIPRQAFHGFFCWANPLDKVAHLLNIDGFDQDKVRSYG